MTGYATRDSVSRIAKVGNTAEVLAKPIVFERLLKTLDSLEAVNTEHSITDNSCQ